MSASTPSAGITIGRRAAGAARSTAGCPGFDAARPRPVPRSATPSPPAEPSPAAPGSSPRGHGPARARALFTMVSSTPPPAPTRACRGASRRGAPGLRPHGPRLGTPVRPCRGCTTWPRTQRGRTQEMPMSTIDPRTPVVVGAGQLLQTPPDPADALEPVEMMAEAVGAPPRTPGAAGLAGAGRRHQGGQGRVALPRPGSDPGRSPRCLAPPDGVVAPTAATPPSRSSTAPAWTSRPGELDVVVLVGGEGIWSRRRARRAGRTHPLHRRQRQPEAEVLGHELTMSSQAGDGARLRGAGQHLPDVRERHPGAAGRDDPASTATGISELWERFNQVAVENPYAWLRTPMTRRADPHADADNRMVGFPYTKSMNSNWDLDQAAALILCSAAAAEAAGVARDRWVFPWSGTDAHDTMLFSERDNFWSSPGHPHRRAGRLRAGGPLGRRRRPRRPLLLLPLGGADRRHRARPVAGPPARR